MTKRLSVRSRIFLIFAALATGSIATLAAGLYLGFHMQDEPDTVDALVVGGTVAGFTITSLISWVWLMFDDNVAKPIERMAGALRTRTNTSIKTELDLSRADYLGDLAPAARELVHALDAMRESLADSTEVQTANLVYEKALLETLLTDIAAGVLMCSASHQLVFYNVRAVSLIGGLDADATPGLNRSLFEFLRPAPIQAAYARLELAGALDAASDILCSTQASGTTLLARMRLLPRHTSETTRGYILTLHNNATMTLQGWDQPIVSPGRQALWMVHAKDLANALEAQLNAKGYAIRHRAADLILRCNGFHLVALLAALARYAAAHGPDIYMEISADGAGALICLEWKGGPVHQQELRRLMTLAVDTSPAHTTVQAVLANHAASLDAFSRAPEHAGLRMHILDARLAHPRPAAIPHALVYDFDLLFKNYNTELSDTHMEDLTYVVFDTETTGLHPDHGDKIVQLAAVRIVNGRRVRREVFQTLVNPGRKIPLSSTNVHGITDQMVATAPTMDTVGRKFHQFIKGAVLVAHNAPFDMAFLRQHEHDIGCRFDNPIVDTVLLSAVVFGQSEDHNLDALSHRLGITITEEDRHTAIGDAIATADVFLKLLPALKARGLETFGDVLAEVRKQRRLLEDLNV
jgi:DNA polymerase-3 subunit epsilon